MAQAILADTFPPEKRGLAFALYGVLYADAGCIAETMRVDYSPRTLGIRTNVLAMLLILVLAGGYIVVDRRRWQLRTAGLHNAGQPVRMRALQPRSSKATAGTIGLEVGLPPGLPPGPEPPDPAPRDLA